MSEVAFLLSIIEEQDPAGPVIVRGRCELSGVVVAMRLQWEAPAFEPDPFTLRPFLRPVAFFGKRQNLLYAAHMPQVKRPGRGDHRLGSLRLNQTVKTGDMFEARFSPVPDTGLLQQLIITPAVYAVIRQRTAP